MGASLTRRLHGTIVYVGSVAISQEGHRNEATTSKGEMALSFGNLWAPVCSRRI
jgi:hypothetical protein